MKITRPEFIKRIFRVLLATLLALVAFSLGTRTVSGKTCSSCSGKGKCNGEIDCTYYLK